MSLPSIIAVALCLGSPLASANSSRVGHTVNNGGGNAELALVELATRLPGRLSTCLHALNPCGLSSVMKEIAEDLNRAAAAFDPARVPSTALYRADSTPLSETEIHAVLLAHVHASACTSQMTSSRVNFMELAAALESVRAFRRVETEGAVILRRELNTDALVLDRGQGQFDLLAGVRAKLGLAPEATLRLALELFSETSTGIELRLHVRFGAAHEARVLLLLSDLNAPTRTRVLVLEGGRGAP